MKIGVISDTHIPAKAAKLPDELVKALKGCDLIMHAGDLVELSVLEDLEKITKVEAVYGNMASANVRATLPENKILRLCGKVICLMHGYGNPDNLIDILKKRFLSEKPDIIVYGHSHRPTNELMDGVLFFNPGSCTDTVFASYRSYGIIEIDKDKIKAEIHKL